MKKLAHVLAAGLMAVSLSACEGTDIHVYEATDMKVSLPKGVVLTKLSNSIKREQGIDLGKSQRLQEQMRAGMKYVHSVTVPELWLEMREWNENNPSQPLLLSAKLEAYDNADSEHIVLLEKNDFLVAADTKEELVLDSEAQNKLVDMLKNKIISDNDDSRFFVGYKFSACLQADPALNGSDDSDGDGCANTLPAQLEFKLNAKVHVVVIVGMAPPAAQ